MKKAALLASCLAALAVSGCSTPLKGWVSEKQADSFYGNTSCRIKYLDPYGNPELGYGTRYYPFIVKTADGKTLFGIENNKREPVGDVLIKVDTNPPIRINQSETEVQDSISYQMPDMSQQSEALRELLGQTRVLKSPITTASEAKSRQILNQIRIGEVMRIRVIGLGINGSTDMAEGAYEIDTNLIKGYARCGL